MDPSSIDHLFLVTGTTRGIGKALAAEVRKTPGSFVVGFSRAAPLLRDDYQNIPIDLNHTDRIGAAFDAIRVAAGRRSGLRQTILINNAGVLEPIAPIMEAPDRPLARNIRVNLIAPMILARHFFRFSRSFPGYKWIVNITSGAARTPYYGWSAYGAAKAGLDMATRIMAEEFERIDPAFRACAVAPGTVDTAMQARIRACNRRQFEQVDKFVALKSRGLLDSPEHVASTLIQLLLAGRFENGGRYDLRQMEG